MSWNGAGLCSYCAKVIAAKAFKAMKGKSNCGARWTAVWAFSETKKITMFQKVIIDMGHLECLPLLNKTSENLGDKIIEAATTKK